MSLLAIAWRSIWQRKFASALPGVGEATGREGRMGVGPRNSTVAFASDSLTLTSDPCLDGTRALANMDARAHNPTTTITSKATLARSRRLFRATRCNAHW